MINPGLHQYTTFLKVVKKLGGPVAFTIGAVAVGVTCVLIPVIVTECTKTIKAERCNITLQKSSIAPGDKIEIIGESKKNGYLIKKEDEDQIYQISLKDFKALKKE